MFIQMGMRENAQNAKMVLSYRQTAFNVWKKNVMMGLLLVKKNAMRAQSQDV